MRTAQTVLALAFKELRVWVTTWTLWVIVVVFAELTSLFSYLHLRDYQQRQASYGGQRALGVLERLNPTELVVQPTFGYAAILMLILLPLITMRLYADERRTGALDLLQTFPVRTWALVAGKFLASLVLVLLMAALLVPIHLTLHLVVPDPDWGLDWGTVSAGYLGLLLLGATVVGLGGWTSSLTSSPLIAAVLTLTLVILSMVTGQMTAELPPPLGDWAHGLSSSKHFDGFVDGAVRTTGVTYFLSLISLTLLLTHRSLESRRWR